jgi:hypothetical protein
METLENYSGIPLDVTLPCGRKVTIREQNGDDDETLSLITNDKSDTNMANINRFLASIILKDHATGNAFMSPEDIKNLRLRSKYYLLMKSRIHSLGPIVKFTNKCTNKNCRAEMDVTEDLSDFDNDLTKYNPDAPHKERSIVPYLDKGANQYHEFTISSQKKLRFKYLDGHGEERALEAYQTRASRNTNLIVRELSIYHDNQWMLLGSFAIFKSAEMGEIQKEIERVDSQFVLASDVECPACKNKMMIPLNAIEGFFFL